MTSKTPDEIWNGAVRELAKQPRAVTADMIRKHHVGSDGKCRGPHGMDLVTWPCSTWGLADAADRLRRTQD